MRCRVYQEKYNPEFGAVIKESQIPALTFTQLEDLENVGIAKPNNIREGILISGDYLENDDFEDLISDLSTCSEVIEYSAEAVYPNQISNVYQLIWY